MNRYHRFEYDFTIRVVPVYVALFVFVSLFTPKTTHIRVVSTCPARWSPQL